MFLRFMEAEYARVENSTGSREDHHQIDEKIIKTHYARDNNSKILTFCIQEDPNLCMMLPSLTIGFSVELPKSCIPDNGFASKLFRTLNLEINSQLITSTKAL